MNIDPHGPFCWLNTLSERPEPPPGPGCGKVLGCLLLIGLANTAAVMLFVLAGVGLASIFRGL